MKRPIARAASVLALWALAAPAWAGLTLGTIPLYLGASVKPLVMLTLSKDQELYKKAYSDYSDLDADGIFETTYKHSINYYGYFDPFKCYSYITANRRFEPQADTSGLAPANQKYCDTVAGEWSGNFLNWATMTRMDAVRKVLYGGLRSAGRTADAGFVVNDGDTQTSTVLERAYLPNDAHAFAKYYDGSDITRLTAATPLAVATTSATNRVIGTGAKTFTVASATNIAVGDIMEFAHTAAPTTQFMRGNVTAVAGTSITINAVFAGGAGSPSAWTVTNLTKKGITICNATLGGTAPNDLSQTNVNMPRMRVAKGNFILWAGNERWQCIWGGETVAGVNGGAAVSAVNSNSYPASQIPASASSPTLATHGTGAGYGDFFVRVQACVTGMIGTEKCKQYALPAPSGTLKPIGLVQVYGEPGLISFGLLTGSYERNVSGGVLRKNAGPISDEIGADGVFLAPPAAGSIISTLNRMRIFGYAYSNGLYNTADSCGFGLFTITQSPVQCTSWGNPMSEIYFETLRYLAGGKPVTAGNPTPTAAYNFTYAGSRDATLGLPVATWADPVTQTNYCAPLNTVVFNSSVSSYDNDQIPGGATKSYLGTISLATIDSGTDAETLTNSVGSGESITGSYFIGRIRAGTAPETNELCDAKTLGASPKGLGNISGLCPEGPTVGGSFLVAGLAHRAHVARIRTDLTVSTANAATSLKVNTYAVQLSSATPRLEILVPGGTPGQKVVLQPACRMTSGGQGGCALVDLRIVSQQRGADFDKGVIYVNWEDSEQGGDYDQDMWGTMSYCLQSGTTTQCPGAPANSITVATDVAAQSTGFLMGLGYIISGTNKDGPHFHSGINNFIYTDSTPTVSLTTLTRVGAVATATRIAHGFTTGDRVTIAGATGTSATFNGTFTITGSTANTFTYSLGAATPVSPAAGAPTVTVGGCGTPACVTADVATKFTYAIGASSAQALKDPLWYATKYGGFKDTNTNDLPDQAIEWDSKREDGSDGADGIPDNYFLVTNPGALESAMDRTFIYILQVSSASSVATNSTSLQTGSRVYQARFNSNDWSGQLLSFTIDVTGTIDPTPNFDAGLKLPDFNSRVIITYNPGASPGTAAPTKGIPFRWNNLVLSQLTELSKDGGSGVADPGVLAIPGDSTPGLCTADNVPSGCVMKGKTRLNWLRGEGANEGVTPTRFRVRATTKLADIVNSTPRFVGPPSGTFADAGYLTFRSTYAGRTPMLYVGSNGGMLHAFDATTGVTGGTEMLAYVPNKMYPLLTKLSAKAYSHRYYVDGTPLVTDACFGASCASGAPAATDWKTVLVGGYNSGAQGYYALDVTDPASWSEGNAGNIVLWEFTDVNDPDLGYSYSKPIIARMANGRWAAIFGNGYNNGTQETGETACVSGTGTVADPYLPAGCSVSLTGHAYLFIVYLDGATDGAWTQGTDYIKISTNTGTDTLTPSAFTPAAPNALTTPAVSLGADTLVRFIYAGDLVGNMWKFDMQSATDSSWAVAQSGTPLFTASDPSGNRQPITSEAALFPHSSGSGLMVQFGTGKYLEVSDDIGPYTVNSLYGIWDRFDPADVTVLRSELMQQKVLNVSAGNKTGAFVAFGKELRLVSAYQPNYTGSVRDLSASPACTGGPMWGDADAAGCADSIQPSAITPANQRGWLYDFPNSGDNSDPSFVTPGTGERVAFAPQISTDKLVVTTLIPSTVPCDAGGTSPIFDIDPVTGGRLGGSAFDLNADNNFTSGDYVTYGGVSIAVSGIYSTIGIVPQPTIIQAQPGKEIKVLSGSSGGLMTIMERGGGGAPPGSRVGRRISWRELLSN